MLGLAVTLAAFSYADWHASAQRLRLRQAFARRGFQVPFHVGLALFATGLLATSHAWWERLAWGVLGVAFLAQACLAARRGQG